MAKLQVAFRSNMTVGIRHGATPVNIRLGLRLNLPLVHQPRASNPASLHREQSAWGKEVYPLRHNMPLENKLLSRLATQSLKTVQI